MVGTMNYRNFYLHREHIAQIRVLLMFSFLMSLLYSAMFVLVSAVMSDFTNQMQTAISYMGQNWIVVVPVWIVSFTVFSLVSVCLYPAIRFTLIKMKHRKWIAMGIFVFVGSSLGIIITLGVVNGSEYFAVINAIFGGISGIVLFLIRRKLA